MNRQGGFTYLAVIFMVAIAGVLAAAQGVLWSSVRTQENREQLKFVGEQYRQAIGSYYEQTPGGNKSFPKHLEDLLEDKRFIVPKRHLRSLYPNPFTDKLDWRLVMTPDAGIMGVAMDAGILEDIAGKGREFTYLPASSSQTISTIKR